MRCSECATDNDEGAAFCRTCGVPLTAYGGQVTGLVSDVTRQRAARLAVRPPIVAVMLAIDVLLVLAWPIRACLAVLLGRTMLNPDSTNYIGAAVSTVNVVATLVVYGIGVTALLLWLAWGTWGQRYWAWLVTALLLGLAAGWGVLGLLAFSMGRAVVAAAAAALLYAWLTPAVREWYGAR